jgi:hypothetical protein
VVVLFVFVVFVVVVVAVAAGGGKGEGFAIFVQKDRLDDEDTKDISTEASICMCKVIVYRSVIKYNNI